MITTKTLSGYYAVKIANSAESIAQTDNKSRFNKLWLYPCSVNPGPGGGLLTINTGTVYIGEKTEGSQSVTPDALPNGGATAGIIPMLIQLPEGESKLLKEVLIQAANVGDGVWFKYWPAAEESQPAKISA